MEIGFITQSTRAVILPLFQTLRDAFYTVFFQWFISVANALISGPIRDLLIPLCIGVGIAILLVSIKFIRKVVWGS